MAIEKRIPYLSIIIITITLFIFYSGLNCITLDYPSSGAKEIMKELENQITEDDLLILYPYANWAFAYYGNWPIRIVEVKDSLYGFYAFPERKDTLLLSESVGGIKFYEDPQVLQAQIKAFLAGRSERIVYIVTSGEKVPNRFIIDIIKSEGYQIKGYKACSGDSQLIIFEKQLPNSARELRLSKFI